MDCKKAGDVTLKVFVKYPSSMKCKEMKVRFIIIRNIPCEPRNDIYFVNQEVWLTFCLTIGWRELHRRNVVITVVVKLSGFPTHYDCALKSSYLHFPMQHQSRHKPLKSIFSCFYGLITKNLPVANTIRNVDNFTLTCNTVNPTV